MPAHRATLPIAIEERPSLSTAEIAARVRKTRSRSSPTRASGSASSSSITWARSGRAILARRSVQQLGQISNDLTALAKSEDVALLALHQLNRGVESRENKRPGLADLRDSGNLEQDADGVWLLFRPAYYLQHG